MLRLSKLADYGALVLDYLQSHREKTVSAAEIAVCFGFGNATVSKILKQLQSAGLVVSERGTQGGYRLAKNPEDITIAAVISALEGQPVLTTCCDHQQSCDHDTHCTLKGNWQKINRIVLQILEGVTLADMSGPLDLNAWSRKDVEEPAAIT